MGRLSDGVDGSIKKMPLTSGLQGTVKRLTVGWGVTEVTYPLRQSKEVVVILMTLESHHHFLTTQRYSDFLQTPNCPPLFFLFFLFS
jgi:hypothetical protein